VTVSTGAGASILTEGHLSSGIHAASVSGGGGTDGQAITGSAFAGVNAELGVGGDGGDFGDGGASAAVAVQNLAAFTTQGVFAPAIEARSVAGGGGSAKSIINAGGVSMGDVSAAVGGGGGNGGDAGTIAVTSGSAISTGSHHSFGILAQSIGGTGGNGGSAVQNSATGGEVSGEIGFAIGGTGCDGGAADAVAVTTADSATADFGEISILAQSIGGSGGAGGSVYTGNLNVSTDGGGAVNIDIGGSGGDGATASTVDVQNAARITTDGHLADGIFAQSIGGNSGHGGSVHSVVSVNSQSSSLNVGVDIGGKGGSGEDAGEVTVGKHRRDLDRKGRSLGDRCDERRWRRGRLGRQPQRQPAAQVLGWQRRW